MADGLARDPRAVSFAQRALANLDRQRMTIPRGGTDRSRFTERGLPTPNLSTGEHNPHSPLEWTCFEEIAQAAEMLVELAELPPEGRLITSRMLDRILKWLNPRNSFVVISGSHLYPTGSVNFVVADWPT